MDPQTELQQEILAKMKALRTSEPSDEPTEEPSAIDISEEVAEEVEEVIEDEATEEVEVVDDNDPIEATDEEESLFFDLNGEETSLSDILSWKDGNLRQSDYTRKTQELAEQRKAFEVKEEEFKAKFDSLESMAQQLEQQLQAGDEKVDWEVGDDGLPLYDDDMPKYLRHKSKQDQRRKSLSDATATRQQHTESERQAIIADENVKLLNALPTWQDAKQRDLDIALITTYVDEAGISHDKVNNMLDHRDFITLLHAAKYADLQKQTKKVSKQVAKAPKVIKPTKTRKKPTSVTALDDAMQKAKVSGSKEDILAAMKLRRKA